MRIDVMKEIVISEVDCKEKCAAAERSATRLFTPPVGSQMSGCGLPFARARC